MPKCKRLDPDVQIQMLISEFFSACSVEKGIVSLLFYKMMALLEHAKGRQLAPAEPEHKAELDKLRAEVKKLKAQANAILDATGEDAGTSTKAREARKKPEKKKE